MTAHAKIGPSSLSRVMVCPGSVRLYEGLPRRTSDAASEGTALHEIAANCLDLGLDPYDFVGKPVVADDAIFYITDDHANCMTAGIDWIREQAGEMFVEQLVNLDPWMPGQFGTMDLGLISPDGKVAVCWDWKFGIGVPVTVADNKQLKAYALGFLHTILRPRGIEPETFRLIIEQPRCPGGGRYGEPWDINLADLLAFGDELRETIRRVEDPAAPLVFSEDGCRFCDVKARPEGCPAYNKFIEDLFEDAFDDMVAEPAFPDTNLIDPARRYHIVRHSKLATQWLAKLHADSLGAAEAGSPDPGSKMVAGQRGDRKWSGPARAEALMVASLGDEAFTRKLKGPALVEKELKPGTKKPGDPEAWAALTQLITQDEGRPILASEDDPRPALKSIEDKFAEL